MRKSQSRTMSSNSEAACFCSRIRLGASRPASSSASALRAASDAIAAHCRSSSTAFFCASRAASSAGSTSKSRSPCSASSCSGVSPSPEAAMSRQRVLLASTNSSRSAICARAAERFSSLRPSVVAAAAITSRDTASCLRRPSTFSEACSLCLASNSRLVKAARAASRLSISTSTIRHGVSPAMSGHKRAHMSATRSSKVSMSRWIAVTRRPFSR